MTDKFLHKLLRLLFMISTLSMAIAVAILLPLSWLMVVYLLSMLLVAFVFDLVGRKIL